MAFQPLDCFGYTADGPGSRAQTLAIRDSKIADSIDDFEFDEALKLLNALREMMRSRTSESATLT